MGCQARREEKPLPHWLARHEVRGFEVRGPYAMAGLVKSTNHQIATLPWRSHCIARPQADMFAGEGAQLLAVL